ncbi:hypothetical protein P7C70_g3047, partial [Phenoliferia sp. Uapishka_3]
MVDLELGTLSFTSESFYEQVSLLRNALRDLDESITTLGTRQQQSLAQGNSGPSTLESEISQRQAGLRNEIGGIKRRIEELGKTVGRDEGRRGHWDGLKASLGKAVGRYQQIEMAQRERIKDRVARQYKIVKPYATDEEVKAVVDSNQGGQIFMQAVASSRSEGAQAALSEAKTRQGEIQRIEQTLMELAELFNQVAELVAEQDVSIAAIEETSRQVEDETRFA